MRILSVFHDHLHFFTISEIGHPRTWIIFWNFFGTGTWINRYCLRFISRCRFSRYCLRFMSGYKEGLQGPLLDFTMKKYKSHRSIPSGVKTLLEADYKKYLDIKKESKKKSWVSMRQYILIEIFLVIIFMYFKVIFEKVYRTFTRTYSDCHMQPFWV